MMNAGTNIERAIVAKSKLLYRISANLPLPNISIIKEGW